MNREYDYTDLVFWGTLAALVAAIVAIYSHGIQDTYFVFLCLLFVFMVFAVLFALRSLLTSKPRSFIFTHPCAVITYQITGDSKRQPEIEGKLNEILNVKPDADLSKHEAVMGIKILDVQYTERNDAKSAPSRDIFIGQ